MNERGEVKSFAVEEGTKGGRRERGRVEDERNMVDRFS